MPAWPWSNSLRILDYGCGPTIPFIISAVPKASEIILAEYTLSNREYVKKWLSKDPSAYNWSETFEHVVKILEGKVEESAKQREDDVRRKVKAVVACDITKDEFIEDAYGEKSSYDVVMCLLCLDSACEDHASFKSAIVKLASLIKKGGYLLLYSTQRENCSEGYYVVNNIKYANVLLSREFLVQTMEENGLCMTDENYISAPENMLPESNAEGFLFIASCKS